MAGMRIDRVKIKLLIAEMGITQTELGHRCGISRQSISTILTRGTCEIRTVGKLAKGLGVKPEDIVKQE